MLELEHVLYGCVCNNTIIGQLITMRHSRLIVRSKRVYPTLIVIFVCCMYVLILCRYCKPKSGIRHNIIRKMRGLIAYQIFILLFNSGNMLFLLIGTVLALVKTKVLSVLLPFCARRRFVWVETCLIMRVLDVVGW